MLVRLDLHGRVAVVTLNRPERLNAVCFPLRSELMAMLARLNADPEVRAIVLTGTGRGFCSGQDLSEAGSMTVEHVSRLFNHQRGMYLALRDLTKGCVAAVNGVAAGEGLYLALCADMRIGHPGVRLGMPEVSVGQANMIGGALMAALAGHGVARELALTGELIDGRRAYELGLLSALVEEAEVLPRAIEAAHQLAAQPPLALALTKRRFRDATQPAFEAACDASVRAAVESFAAGEPQAGMRGFFHARRRAG
jgi:enoyl-CoA hydratase/carnithine racemase